ncbi:hypothetical protein LXL04_010821 [Taraxacum kok-saghyz]
MTTIVEITTHSHFPIKLTSTNFPVWRKQVLSTLIGLDLDKYITDPINPPPKTIDIKPNPLYQLWHRQDQILLGALLSSCSDTIQPTVSSAETAHQAFKCLTDSYASVSRSRIISLKSKLAKNPKGSKSMAEFLHEMKGIADELALAQAPIDEEDLIVHILTQLGDNYKHITAALKVRDTPLTFSDLFAKLVDYERSLHETISAPTIATVNYTQKTASRSTGRMGYDSRNNHRPNNFGPRNNRTQNSGPNSYFHSRDNRNSLFCQFCNIPGHDTKDCRKLSRFLREHNISISSGPQSTPTVNYSTAAASSSPTPPWMFDSGASHHVASDRSSLHTPSDFGGPDEIMLGNGTNLPISHTGNTSLPTNSRSLNLHNVLIVPQLRNNIISVAKLCKSNHVSVEFFPHHFLVKDLRTGAPLMRVMNVNDVYYAAINSLRRLSQINSTTTSTGSLLSWHHKFGHPSIKVLKLLLKNLGISHNNMSSTLFHCDACSINKSHKMPFDENSFQIFKPLELVYTDVWGPVQPSNDGYTYYVIFVDFYSKYCWFYPMKRKSDVSVLFPQFKTLVEKFFHTPLVSLFSDNGGEYTGLIPYLQQHGISHFTTPPHTPEQNGVAERCHRHIVETGLSLLHHAKLPLSFWSHAFETAVHLINRLPTKILAFKSPYTKLYNISPNYKKLKPFGCLCFPWLRPYASSKLHPRSIKCIFLGYSSSKSAYKCYDPTTHRLYHSRHVEFIEHEFTFTPELVSNSTVPTTESFLSTTKPIPQPSTHPNPNSHTSSSPMHTTTIPIFTPTTQPSSPTTPTTPSFTQNSESSSNPSPNPSMSSQATPSVQPSPTVTPVKILL